MPTSLQGIAHKAASHQQHRFGHLYERLTEEVLLACWRDINKNAAYGVDQMSADAYEEHLEDNIRDLASRLTSKSDRAKRVRRHDIPKGDGRMRPLGIPAIEDTRVQLAVARIREAIDEPDFWRCSDGYRPAVGALDAVRTLTITLPCGRYHFVVEADIKGFFDTIDHDWMMRM